MKRCEVDRLARGARKLDQIAGRVTHAHLHLSIPKLAHFTPGRQVDDSGGLRAFEDAHEVRHHEAEVTAKLPLVAHLVHMNLLNGRTDSEELAAETLVGRFVELEAKDVALERDRRVKVIHVDVHMLYEEIVVPVHDFTSGSERTASGNPDRAQRPSPVRSAAPACRLSVPNRWTPSRVTADRRPSALPCTHRHCLRKRA